MQDSEFDAAHGLYMSDIEVGMRAEVTKTISTQDVSLFAQLSGDVNPLHLDPAFAARTRVGGCVAHGMVSASLISTLVGTRLPGPGCLWMGQSLSFLQPVRVGDSVRALAEIIEVIPDKQRVRMHTTCWVDQSMVIEGEALVWVPAR